MTSFYHNECHVVAACINIIIIMRVKRVHVKEWNADFSLDAGHGSRYTVCRD